MRILVVEDEMSIATGLRRGLEAEGYTVDLAADGLDGLSMARETPYAAIILDLMLPEMNGFKVCEVLRAEENWTPILMVTAKDGVYDHAEGLDTGADGYLTKPFAFPVLIAQLRALVRRRSYDRPVSLSVDDLTVDAMQRTCCRGDTEIELTPREFEILQLLLSHVGELLSKNDILAGVWGSDFGGDPNIVEVYVGRLRRKIDSPFERSNLQTVRGGGYRIGPDSRWQN